VEDYQVNFVDYQIRSRNTAVYPHIGNNIIYPTLGLCGESGEVAEKIKKVMRDSGGIINEETRQALSRELGDVLWYLSQLATELGLQLEDIALENIRKLQDRQARNQLQGSGDER